MFLLFITQKLKHNYIMDLAMLAGEFPR